MSFIATINGKQYDNTDNGALFPEKANPGHLVGTFNDGASGLCLPLIAKADPETKTYKLGLVVGGKVTIRGELKAGRGKVHYVGYIGGTKVVGFKAVRRGATYIQIRPDMQGTLDERVEQARSCFDQL